MNSCKIQESAAEERARIAECLRLGREQLTMPPDKARNIAIDALTDMIRYAEDRAAVLRIVVERVQKRLPVAHGDVSFLATKDDYVERYAHKAFEAHLHMKIAAGRFRKRRRSPRRPARSR